MACILLVHNLYNDSILNRTKTLTLPALKSEQLGEDGCPAFASWPEMSILVSMSC
jgi:hypothetical protein